MRIQEMVALADALVSEGVLTKTLNPISMSLSVMGYSSDEIYKTSGAVNSVPNYAPVKDNTDLSNFYVDNRTIAQKVADEEMLLSLAKRYCGYAIMIQ